MAFIGLMYVSILYIVIVLILGLAPFIIGTVLYRKTEHKKLGIGLRIFGYIVMLPSLILDVMMIFVRFAVWK